MVLPVYTLPHDHNAVLVTVTLVSSFTLSFDGILSCFAGPSQLTCCSQAQATRTDATGPAE